MRREPKTAVNAETPSLYKLKLMSVTNLYSSAYANRLEKQL